jgi:hypothetical protein
LQYYAVIMEATFALQVVIALAIVPFAIAALFVD